MYAWQEFNDSTAGRAYSNFNNNKRRALIKRASSQSGVDT